MSSSKCSFSWVGIVGVELYGHVVFGGVKSRKALDPL